MKPPRDAVGNPLAEGNLVYVELKKPFVLGRVAKLSTGGLALPGKRITKGAAIIVAEITMDFIPESQLGGILKVVDPDAEKKISGLLASQEPKKPTN